MTARNLVWLSIGGGAWSLASNWNDLTNGTDPALVAPGVQDSVTVTGPTGAAIQTMTGGGAAAAAIFAGNTQLSGAYSIAAVTLGLGGGGILQLASGASLAAGMADIAAGSLLVGGHSTLAVAGTLTLGTAGMTGAALNATGGGSAAVSALFLADSADSIYVDTASIVEVGSTGGALAGALTIDTGATLAGQGNADEYGIVANFGTLTASGGTLTVGALTGTGSVQIGAGDTLALAGPCGAGQAIVFAGANATLALNQEAFAPAGIVSGFATGDTIDVRGSQISSASFTPTGASGGELDLFYGTQVAAQIALAGNYAGDVFVIAADGAGGSVIGVAPGSGGGGKPSPGTSTPDIYLWTAGGSGAWNTAANWQDLTTGATPAAIAPGAANLVSIVGDLSNFWVIAGPANAASLTILGDVALTGAFAPAMLTVGAGGANALPGTLDLLAGGTARASSAWVADGAIAVAGAGARLSVAGTLTLGAGGIAGIGLPTASLLVNAGALVQAQALVMGDGSGASIIVDPTGTVEIGGAGGAAAGAVTIDAGATLTGNGQVDRFGSVVDNGTILALGGTLSLGTVTGTGTLLVAAGATLELNAPTAAPIVLQGSAASGPATLALTTEWAIPTGILSGLVAGDVIHLEGSPLTSVQYSPPVGGPGTGPGALALIYNTTIVGRIAIAGLPSGLRFLIAPDGIGGTTITVAVGAGGGGGGGQGGTDQLAWTNPVSGSWSRAGNWTDLTLGAPATLPPGAQTPVQIAGPGGLAFESIAGTGTSASLVLTGNTALSGLFATGQLTVGQAPAGGVATAGILDIGPATTLSASAGTIADGDLLVSGQAARLSVSGTLALGGSAPGAGQPDTLLAAMGRATVQLGGLTLGGGASDTVTVDAVSVIEIGSAGAALPGVLTVDAGASVTGNGALDTAGQLMVGGLVEAQGGTLWVGAVAGTGTLSISTEASLVLGATEACPIVFAGGGATLVLPGMADIPSAPIAGFAVGDSIVLGFGVDAVAYQPGIGGIGTLTLSSAGQAIGQLLLAGSFAGENFSVQPAAGGAAIVLSGPGNAGPPPGTATPDVYLWTGIADGTAWASAGNWTDTTQGAGPAAVAPGQNDFVTITGRTGLAVTGPADAAGLSLAGTVALTGAYAVGLLAVGGGQPALLALGAGAALSAANATVLGGLSVGGGALSVEGTMTLGATGGAGGVLAASGGGTIRLGAARLEGAGSTLAVDATGSIEIGGTAGAASGSIVIDAGGVLQGAGTLGAFGQTIDQGTITASGGTLLLGSVSGSGTLLIGAGADLVLAGPASPGLTVDFAGPGTLTLASPSANPGIADFGAGSTILLNVTGATSADYAATGAGIGVLSIDAGIQVLAQLTLLGSQANQSFSVAGTAGGGTSLTTQADKMSGPGGNTMPYPNLTTGQITRGAIFADIALGFPQVPQDDFANLIGSGGIYLDVSTDGLAPADTVFGGANQPAGVNIEVVLPLVQTGPGVGPGGNIVMAPGYSAVFLEGTAPQNLFDNAIGHALLVGNFGGGEIVASGEGDTLVGAPGASTTFWASLKAGTGSNPNLPDVFIHGGGNDVIATNYDNAAVTTAGGHSSKIFLGPAPHSAIVSNGADGIYAAGGSDTIFAQAPAGSAGDTVFGGSQGLITFYGGDAPATLVGTGGGIAMYGGAGSGSLLWGGTSDVNYYGGTGSALIIGGTGYAQVIGGQGPVTVFGGTGEGLFSGGAGSVFVVGNGPSTVTASAGATTYVTGSAPVSIAGGQGADVFAGTSTGNNIFQAIGGNETLWGGAGNDTFLVGNGNNLFLTGGGGDSFNFTNGLSSGTDTVYGFVPGQSSIALHGYGNQMPFIAISYGSSVISLQNGATIILANVTNLTAANFTFA